MQICFSLSSTSSLCVAFLSETRRENQLSTPQQKQRLGQQLHLQGWRRHPIPFKSIVFIGRKSLGVTLRIWNLNSERITINTSGPRSSAEAARNRLISAITPVWNLGDLWDHSENAKKPHESIVLDSWLDHLYSATEDRKWSDHSNRAVRWIRKS